MSDKVPEEQKPDPTKLGPGESWDATAGATKEAEKQGIDMAQVEGSGSGGTVTKDDVTAHKAAASKLAKKTLTNTGFHTRRWDSLQRLEDRIDDDGQTIALAGSTLELEPGESALVSVSGDFEDPWLKDAKVGASKKDGSKKEV
jgi:hypothetical protein